MIRIEQKTALNSGFLLLCGAQHCFIAIYGIQKLATERELSDFLIQVERRAFKQAVFAVHDDHAALRDTNGLDALPESGVDMPKRLESQEREFVAQALRQAGGRHDRAARLLGISSRQFRYLLDKHELR